MSVKGWSTIAIWEDRSYPSELMYVSQKVSKRNYWESFSIAWAHHELAPMVRRPHHSNSGTLDPVLSNKALQHLMYDLALFQTQYEHAASTGLGKLHENTGDKMENGFE